MRFGAGAFLIHDGHVLLNRRSRNECEPLTWCCFGGKSEPGEGQMACLYREVEEETGLDVRAMPTHLVDMAQWPRNDFMFFTYAVALPSRMQPRLSSESMDSGWFPMGGSPDRFWDHMPHPMHSGLLDLMARRNVASEMLGFAMNQAQAQAHAQAHAQARRQAPVSAARLAVA